MLLTPLRIPLSVLAAAFLLVAAGCGEDQGHTSAAQPPPAPVGASAAQTGNVPRVRPADLREPISRYRRFVAARLDEMKASLDELEVAASTGSIEHARSAWREADRSYESIGAAYGAFGDLDARINETPASLARGIRSDDFVGLHRVELALWGKDSTDDAMSSTRGLIADVSRLKRRVARLEIDPLDYVVRAHEVFEDTLNLELSGIASPWADSALLATRANLRGTTFIFATVRTMALRRNPAVVQAIEISLARLRGALRSVGANRANPPRWSTLPKRSRELIAGRTAAAAEELAYIPALIDPRKPIRDQRVFGRITG